MPLFIDLNLLDPTNANNVPFSTTRKNEIYWSTVLWSLTIHLLLGDHFMARLKNSADRSIFISFQPDFSQFISQFLIFSMSSFLLVRNTILSNCSLMHVLSNKSIYDSSNNHITLHQWQVRKKFLFFEFKWNCRLRDSLLFFHWLTDIIIVFIYLSLPIFHLKALSFQMNIVSLWCNKCTAKDHKLFICLFTVCTRNARSTWQLNLWLTICVFHSTSKLLYFLQANKRLSKKTCSLCWYCSIYRLTLITCVT